MSGLSSTSLSGPVDPTVDAGWGAAAQPRMGFFTDTSVCIGCKACEVACKEWNDVPADGLDLLGMSYDNTGALGASTWRHVAFIEQRRPLGHQESGLGVPGPGAGVSEALHDALAARVGAADANAMGTDTGSVGDLGPVPLPAVPAPDGGRADLRWLMASDVCKHCTHAACLDVCPTGSIFRTETGTVVVQEDICNGCGYCIPACPYGVIDQRPEDGRAFKCTLCYDRTGAGLTPACAQACPTQSIQYGELDELRERAATRVAALHEAGVSDARLYGHDESDGVGGVGAFFLLLDEPEAYGMPPDPVVTTRDLPAMYKAAGVAALGLVAACVGVFAAGGRR